MFKIGQRKNKLIARAISAYFLMQTCVFPSVHVFAEETPQTVSATEKNITPTTKIKLKESSSNSFKDKSDSELWAALGITRAQYDGLSMSQFNSFIENRHANDEGYKKAISEKQSDYELPMTEAETEMLNRKNKSFNWQAENARNKVNGYFVRSDYKQGDSSRYQTGGSAVKHAFENWDTLSESQRQAALMTAVRIGYGDKVTSDSDKFHAVENLQKVINAYMQNHPSSNVYEAVSDFMKSNNIDFDKALKDADNAQQQVNQTSDNKKTTNGAEEKKSPCPTGYKHDEVSNICCAVDSEFDKAQGKCKKELKAEDVCNKGFTLDTTANKCCPTGSSYDFSKNSCVIKATEEGSGGSSRNKQVLGALASYMMGRNKAGGLKNSDPDVSGATTDDKKQMSPERAKKFLSVPFDFRFSYGDDDPASQRYFGEKDKNGNVIVAGSNSNERINITIHDRGAIQKIEENIKKLIDRKNKANAKNGEKQTVQYPKVAVSLRIFNTEAIDNGTLDAAKTQWYAPYSALKQIEGATNGIAEYKIELDKPEVVIPQGMRRPAGEFKVFVVYHIPVYNEKTNKIVYQDRDFQVSYTVYNTTNTLSSSEYSPQSNDVLGVAKVADGFGQLEAVGQVDNATWNVAEETCDMTVSGKFSEANQTTEYKGAKVRSKSISKEDCESSAGKQVSFGKLTSLQDNSAKDGNALADFDYDDDGMHPLGGSVTLGEKVVQDGGSALDDEFSETVNRGKHISSRQVDTQNLDYVTVGDTPLAYNSATNEFYNYDGTPLSSGQKKAIASALGTTYSAETNHINADIKTNADGTFTLTRNDGTSVTGTKLNGDMVSELQQSAENIRGNVLRELAEDRLSTIRHYTSYDQYQGENGSDYRYMMSNPQSKLQSDVLKSAYSTLGLESTSMDYAVRGLNTAFDISGSPAAKVNKNEAPPARFSGETSNSIDGTSSSNEGTSGNPLVGKGGINTSIKGSETNPLVASSGNSIVTVKNVVSSSTNSSPSSVSPETVMKGFGTTHNVGGGISNSSPKDVVLQ